MKKCFLLFTCLWGVAFAYPHHNPSLAPVVKMLYQLEDTKQLIEHVEEEGCITIQTANLGRDACNAVWMPDQRTICLNTSQRRSHGSLLTSLVFELHNALSNRKFEHIDNQALQGKLSKQKYVESVEYTEYSNALSTVEILRKGVQTGVFPRDVYWPIAQSFNEHFRIQIESGHSDLVAQNYDNLLKWQSQNKNRKSFSLG